MLILQTGERVDPISECESRGSRTRTLFPRERKKELPGLVQDSGLWCLGVGATAASTETAVVRGKACRTECPCDFNPS